MKKILYAVLLVLATAVRAAAYDITAEIPEIDASAVAGGVGLLTIGLFMFRARSKR